MKFNPNLFSVYEKVNNKSKSKDGMGRPDPRQNFRGEPTREGSQELKSSRFKAANQTMRPGKTATVFQ